MEFLELVNAGLLLTVQCVAAAAQPQSGLGWGDGGICRLKASLWLPHSAAKTWWEFPKPTFFYCQEFCPGPIFSWLRLLEGEKYWNKSHHRLSSPHCHCWWYWLTRAALPMDCVLRILKLSPDDDDASYLLLTSLALVKTSAEAGWRWIVSRDAASYSSSHAQCGHHSVTLVTSKTKVSWTFIWRIK